MIWHLSPYSVFHFLMVIFWHFIWCVYVIVIYIIAHLFGPRDWQCLVNPERNYLDLRFYMAGSQNEVYCEWPFNYTGMNIKFRSMDIRFYPCPFQSLYIYTQSITVNRYNSSVIGEQVNSPQYNLDLVIVVSVWMWSFLSKKS